MLTIPTIATAMSARTARDLPLRRGDPGVGVGDEGAGAVPITASASPLPPAVATQAPTTSMTTVEPRGALWPGRGDCATTVSSCGPSVRTEERTSELRSLMRTSYAVFCLKKKQQANRHTIAT